MSILNNMALGTKQNAGLSQSMDPRYNIVEPTLTYVTTDTENDTVTATFEDRSVNLVTLGGTIAYASFTFPQKISGKARDFVVRMVLTGETLPTITFQEAGGTEISFDAADDAWAEVEQGVNVFSFTDTSMESV